MPAAGAGAFTAARQFRFFMIDQLQSLSDAALAEIAGVHDDAALEEFRVKYLGKKGSVTALSAGMRDVAPEQRAAVGAKFNEVRNAITSALDEKKAAVVALRRGLIAR